MSNYRRVLPRDLFNEADLLKCLGRLHIALGEPAAQGHDATFDEEDLPFFDIEQDPGSGAVYVANLTFRVSGVAVWLWRPLNSRKEWPLWVGPLPTGPYFDDIEVFDAHSALTADFLALIGAGRS